MSEREQALNIVRTMPDDKITALLVFLRAFWGTPDADIPNTRTAEDIPNTRTAEDIPNAETLSAMEETDEMIRTGGGQHFTGSTADFFAMLDAG